MEVVLYLDQTSALDDLQIYNRWHNKHNTWFLNTTKNGKSSTTKIDRDLKKKKFKL